MKKSAAAVVLICFCLFCGFFGIKEFQNQYLEKFGLDFIETAARETAENEYGAYIKIELSEFENEKFLNLAQEDDSVFLSADTDLYKQIYSTYADQIERVTDNVLFLDDGYYSFFDYENNVYNQDIKTDHFLLIEYTDDVVYLYRIR